MLLDLDPDPDPGRAKTMRIRMKNIGGLPWESQVCWLRPDGVRWPPPALAAQNPPASPVFLPITIIAGPSLKGPMESTVYWYLLYCHRGTMRQTHSFLSLEIYSGVGDPWHFSADSDPDPHLWLMDLDLDLTPDTTSFLAMILRMQMRVRMQILILIFVWCGSASTFHPDADPDPDPSFQIKAQTLEKVLK